jgi:DUF4097 and DUF4098 domain-containing protein YvlB
VQLATSPRGNCEDKARVKPDPTTTLGRLVMKRTETFNIAIPSIEIDNAAGKVEFATHDESTVVVTIESMQRNTDEVVGDTKIVAHGNDLRISVPNRTGFKKREVLVRIAMPKSSAVKVSTVSADVESQGSIDSVIIKTVSGDVRLDTVKKFLTLKSVSGDVDIAHSPEDASASTVSGDLRLNAFSGRCSATSVSGNCLLHAHGSGEITAKTVSGDVTVWIEPDIEIDVAAKTHSGKLSSDIELDPTISGAEGPSLIIRARSVSGDIQIRRASLVAG